MELKENSTVIRVPLADPSSKKEGVLHFALPRACVTADCEPRFYATSDTFEATEGRDETPPQFTAFVAASGPAAEPATAVRAREAEGADVGTLLDLALDAARDGRRGLQSLSGDLNYAGFTLRRTQSDFQRLSSPLALAEGDSPTRDVHEAGKELDFILWGARNGLHDSQQGAVRVAGDAHNAIDDLGEAVKHLHSARQTLDARDQGVIALLEEAEKALQTAQTDAKGMDQRITSSASGLREADGGLFFADQYVTDIRNDRPGVDVSESAVELRSAVDGVTGSLSRMAEVIENVRGDLPSASEAAERAEQALEKLRERLAKG